MAFHEHAPSSIRQVKHQAPAFSVECAVCVRAIKRTGAFSAALVSALPIHQSFRSRLGLRESTGHVARSKAYHLVHCQERNLKYNNALNFVIQGYPWQCRLVLSIKHDYDRAIALSASPRKLRLRNWRHTLHHAIHIINYTIYAT
jgi:hypothetical protein